MFKIFFLSDNSNDFFFFNLTTIEFSMLPKYRPGMNSSLINNECFAVVLIFKKRNVKGLMSCFLMIYVGSLTLWQDEYGA